MKRFFFLLALGTSLAWAQGLDVIKLRHRTADQLLPQLLPFVEAGGVMNGSGDTLFLRASARNQAEIRQLLDALDQPQRRLLISVRQDGAVSSADSGAGVSGRVEVGAGGTAISGRGHLYQSDSRSRRDISQQVQTIDGGRAAIMVGQSYFLPMRQLVLGPGGAILSETLVRRDLASGFVAVPRVAGDRVTLEVSPRDDTPGAQPGSVHSSRLVTTVSGRLGEWIELGGASGIEEAGSTGIASYGTRSASGTLSAGDSASRAGKRRLLVKVDALP